MRRLPLIAALLAWPATPGTGGPVATADDPGPREGDESAPQAAPSTMASPAFGLAGESRAVRSPAAVPMRVSAHSRWRTGTPAAPDPAAFAGFETANAAPMPEAEPASGTGAASFPQAAAGARLQLAMLLQPVAPLDRSHSDAATVAIAPDLAVALAPQSQVPRAEAPVLPYDTGGFDAAPPTPPAAASPPPRLAYDTGGLSNEAALADGDDDGAGARPSPPTVAYPDSGSEQSVFTGDFLIVAAGAVALPSYDGSNDTSVIPAAAVAGSLGGIGINPRAGGLALDVVPDAPGAKVGLSFGPVVRMRTNRTGHIKDPVVARLGELDTVIEMGVAAGVTIRQVLNPHDRLSLGADMRWDVSGRGSGYTISPSASYLTPLSRAMVVGLLVSAEFADGRYAHYNYDVTQAGAVASGLPAYSAKGGLKSVNYGLFVARDLNANLLDGGISVGLGAMYGHLYGSAAESPITSIRGSRSQWIVGGGLGYVF